MIRRCGAWLRLRDVSPSVRLTPHLLTAQTLGSGHFSPLLVPDQINAMISAFVGTFLTSIECWSTNSPSETSCSVRTRKSRRVSRASARLRVSYRKNQKCSLSRLNASSDESAPAALESNRRKQFSQHQTIQGFIVHRQNLARVDEKNAVKLRDF